MSILGSITTNFILFFILQNILNKNHQSDENYFIAENETESCKEDDFKLLKFENELNEKIYLKYKFLENRDTFENIYNECKQQGSTMWQVLEGSPEWDKMFALAKAENKTDLWIAADVMGDCVDGYNCLETEAEQGNGISVNYPPNESVHYSRLHRSPSAGQNCVFIEDNEPYLWTVDSCFFKKFGLCVKRNCFKNLNSSDINIDLKSFFNKKINKKNFKSK